jgi:hypothetical protein
MPVTLPPVLIVLNGTAPHAQPLILGTWEYSAPARIYQLIIGAVDTHVKMMKSLDGGATWARMDAAGEIVGVDQPPTAVQSGNSILVSSTDGATHELFVQAFDVSTDTWGVASAAGPVIADSALQNEKNFTRLIVVGSDIWAFFVVGNGTGQKIQYAVLSGGVWGAAVNLVNTVGVQSWTRQIILDPSGLLFHVVYTTTPTSGTTLTLKYLTLTIAGGVISAPATIVVADVNDLVVVGAASIENDTLYLPWHQSKSVPVAGVWQGSPLSAPVWAFVPVDTNSYAATAVSDTWFSFDSGGLVYLFWSIQDFVSLRQQLYYAVNAGAGWSGPTLYYDALINPPIPAPADPADQFIHNPSGALLASGLFAISLGLESDTGGHVPVHGSSNRFPGRNRGCRLLHHDRRYHDCLWFSTERESKRSVWAA